MVIFGANVRIMNRQTVVAYGWSAAITMTEERALCRSCLILFLSLGGTMQENSSSSTAYDDAYRTMLEKCSSLVLPVINELFGDSNARARWISRS